MEFRRPLGVLLASVAIGALAVAIGQANANPRGSWVVGMIADWALLVALFAALGAFVVIVWRLLRRPRT